jgi:CTD kinase subunit gamma
MNNRANIMYFIEHLCDMAARENHTDYVRMMQRDILRVVDAVAPDDGSGAANVKVVRKVLQGLQTKSFLLPQTVLEIEELLKERDTSADAVPLSSPVSNDVEMTGTEGVRSLREKVVERPGGTKIGGMKNGVGKLDKKQVEQRIEEDRERHKRLRENIWAVAGDGEKKELEKTWEEGSDFGEDDAIVIEEEEEEREMAMGDFKEEYREKIYGGGE